MALAAILSLVKNRLTFATTILDATIEEFIVETQYSLQKYLKKQDAEVEDEAAYNALEKMLIADLTALAILQRKIIEFVAGDSEGNVKTVLTKAKADVVEVNFEQSGQKIDLVKIENNLKTSACEKAKMLGFTLPMCMGEAREPTKPFIHIPDDTYGRL